MFVGIREEDIRKRCPEYAPMTLQVLNKLYPVEEETFETTGRLKQLPRMVYAPSSIKQLSEQITRLNLNPSATPDEFRINEKMIEKQILENTGLDLLSQLPDVPRNTEEEEENLDNVRAVNSYMNNLFSRTFREVPDEEEKDEEEQVEVQVKVEPDKVEIFEPERPGSIRGRGVQDGETRPPYITKKDFTSKKEMEQNRKKAQDMFQKRAMEILENSETGY